MGPIILLDKSTIQALSDDEMGFLTKHYKPVLPPILTIETLANIKYPEIRPEIVPILAKKLHLMTDLVPHFQDLAIANMEGHPLPMDGRIPRAGGEEVITEKGEKGIFFEEAPERKAIREWQQSNFTEAEKVMVRRWEEYIKSQDLEALKKKIDEQTRLRMTKVKSLQELKMVNDAYLKNPVRQESHLESLLKMLHASPDERVEILKRWKVLGQPSLAEFAPYAFYCYGVHMYFYAGITFGLITPKKTHRKDMEYIFYLPFCMVFCSSDNFQLELALIFKRPDQEVIEGAILKKDLSIIKSKWNILTRTEQKEYAKKYACYPPEDQSSITHRLWKRYMKPWSGKQSLDLTPEQSRKIIEEMRPFFDAIDKAKKAKKK